MRTVTRQAMNYTYYDGKTHINSDENMPIVVVRGKSYGCTFIVTDDGVVHMSLHKDGMEHVKDHPLGKNLHLQPSTDMYIGYQNRPDFDWYQVPYVNTTNLKKLVRLCKEVAHLNIKGKPRKLRKGEE